MSAGWALVTPVIDHQPEVRSDEQARADCAYWDRVVAAPMFRKSKRRSSNSVA